MSKLANPLGIRVARQKGLFWSDNHPFFYKKSNYRDFLHLSRYLDFVFIHFQRFLRTIYSQPPFIALGRNYNITGFGDDRSLVIDLHYFDLFGTLTSVPRRVGQRYRDGLDSLKEARWKLFVNPKLARRASFYNLFHIFSLGSLFNLGISANKRNQGFSRKNYVHFFNRLFKPQGNKTLHALSSNLGYRAMSNFMYLAYCSSNLAPDVALVRFKRVAAEVRLKLMMLHLLRRTKVIKKRWTKLKSKKSLTYLIKGWRVLFKAEKVRKKYFKLEKRSNRVIDEEHPFVEPKRLGNYYNAQSGRYRYYNNIRRKVARLKSNITFRWPYSYGATRRDIRDYIRLLNLVNQKTYYSFFTRRFARSPVFPNYVLYRQLRSKKQSFKGTVINTNLKKLRKWAIKDKNKWKKKERYSGRFGLIYDFLMGLKFRRNVKRRMIRKNKRVKKYLRRLKDIRYFSQRKLYRNYIKNFKNSSKKIPKNKYYQPIAQRRPAKKKLDLLKKRVPKILQKRVEKRRLHKIYTIVKYLFKVTRYVKNKNKLLTKVLSIGQSAIKFRYFKFINKIIFYRDRHLSWIRPKKKKKLAYRQTEVRKNFAALRVKAGAGWVLINKRKSTQLPRLRYLRSVQIKEDFFEIFRQNTWLSRRTFYETYRGIVRKTAVLARAFRLKSDKNFLQLKSAYFKKLFQKYLKHGKFKNELSFYVRKTRRLYIGDNLLPIGPFERKWKGVNNGLLVVRRHKNFMLRMKPAGIGFFKKRHWRDTLYRRKITRYKALSFYQQVVWKMLRFGVNASVSYLDPLMVRSDDYKQHFNSRAKNILKKRSFKRVNINRKNSTLGINFSVLTSPINLGQYGLKNNFSSLKAVFFNKIGVYTGYNNYIGDQNPRQKSVSIWNNNKLINSSLNAFLSQSLLQKKIHVPVSKARLYFLPIKKMNTSFPKFGLFRLNRFNEDFKRKRWYKNLTYDKSTHRMIKRKLVIYSVTGRLTSAILFKRKNLILARKLYLEQLVDVANKQKFSSSKFRFFRKKLLKLSRNHHFYYKKLKRRARRRHVVKPLPFGAKKRFFQSSDLRQYISYQLGEQDWIVGPARHHRIYSLRKLFRIHFFILNMLYMDGLVNEVKFIGVRSYRRWQRFKSFKGNKKFSIMRKVCMGMGIVYQLYFRSVILKNKLIGYMTVYFFQYIVITFFEKMFNKFLTLYNFKSICVRLNPTDDFLSAAFIGKFIIGELRKEFSVQYVLRQIRRGFAFIIRQGRIRGYRILLSGRFSRRQMATYIAESRGQVALGAISANIDYSMYQFVARFGMCAVKVWLDLPGEGTENNENDEDREEENYEA